MGRIIETIISLFMVLSISGCTINYTESEDYTEMFDAYSGRRFRVRASRVEDYQQRGYVTSFEYDTYIKSDRERVNRALMLRWNGQYDEAIKELSTIGSHPKMIAERYCWIGTCLQLKGDYDGAIAAYAQSIAVDPPRAWSYTYYGRGVSHMCKGDYVQAEKDFHKAIDIHPGDWDEWGYLVWKALAELYRRTGDEKKRSDAIENARRAGNFKEGPLYLLDPEYYREKGVELESRE